MHNNNTTTTTTTTNNNGKNNHHHHHHQHYYNNFHPMPPSISPRISFSNDFVESQGGGGRGAGAAATALPPRVPSCPEAASSSDFEFSVSNHNMMSADELFFKGRILPSFRGSKTTLREELLVEEDGEGEEVLARPPMRGIGGSSAVGRWKGLLGLRKAGKKGDSSNKCEGSGDRSFDNNSSQEMMNDGIVNKFK